MPQIVNITVTGVVPEGDAEVGHEAVFVTRDAVAALVAQLQAIGIEDVQSARRIIASHAKHAKHGFGALRPPRVVKPAA